MGKSSAPFLTRVAKANTSDSLRTTIPKEIVREFDLNAHDVLVWQVNKKTNEFIIKKWSGKT